ncbi:MAG: DNA-binding transcriptional regulator [Pseudomonadota bacterium]|nr:DNA-binding transcriptional regulator [Pseudomonadota bacterium]MEE2859696.1 DNA-binding transcriptional regulator [Pseudomonadota bacterium]
MDRYKHVEGLLRGLSLLKAMNLEEGGYASISTLSERTGLHRTTVKRLMETLVFAGFVQPAEDRRGYVLALAVRELSEGFTDEAWVTGIAGPALGELVERVVWPSDFTTPQADQMVIRETTRRFSPFSFHRSMVGQRLPMLQSSAGRAFLGFCTENQREAVIRHLQRDVGDNAMQDALRETVEHAARETAAVGYGWNYGGWTRQQQFGGIALPVVIDGHVLACVSVVFLIKSLSLRQAEAQFLPHLSHAVKRIQDGLEDFGVGEELIPVKSSGS